MSADPTPKTCHFCGHVDVDEDGLEQWWRLAAYRGLFTGLACSECAERLAAFTEDEITALKIAEKLSPEEFTTALKRRSS